MNQSYLDLKEHLEVNSKQKMGPKDATQQIAEL